MRVYNFRYEDDLVCSRLIDGDVKRFYGQDALNLLAKKDKLNYLKAFVRNNRLVLENFNTRIVISDIKEMYENGIFSYFYRNMKKINKAFDKYNKKGKVSKGKYVGVASVGVLAAIMLGLTAGKIQDKTNQVDTTSIEFDVEDEELREIVIDITPTQTVQMMVDEEESKFQEVHDESNQILTSADELIAELDAMENIDVVNLEYDGDIDQKKLDNVYNNYYDTIMERATRWGVSPILAQCMLTQESGGYNSNLMQIQFYSWKDYPITLHNFETGKDETIILTNNPENYTSKPGTQIITEQDLANPKCNISVGCIILQYSFERMNHNIPAAIQCYNFGTNNMNKVLNATANEQGCSVDDILSEQGNLSWLDHRNIINVGDGNYLENVLRYAQGNEDAIWMQYINQDGEIEQINISVENNKSL